MLCTYQRFDNVDNACFLVDRKHVENFMVFYETYKNFYEQIMLCFVLVTLFTAISQHATTERNLFQRPSFYKRHTINTYHPLPPFRLHSNSEMTFRERRGTVNSNYNNDASCYRSAVLQNVTLKGGIEAGYFRKLAEHVAMKLCVELCCEEKGCDVAFMWGKHCYGVQCFSHELCETVPAKQQVDESLMLSHVTFHAQKQRPAKRKQPQCISTEVQPGVTLRAGLKSGNFTHLGTVTDMKTCVRLCCAKKYCDLALVLNDQCFALSCFNPSLCEMSKAFSVTYRPDISYVLKSEDRQNSTVISQSDDPTGPKSIKNKDNSDENDEDDETEQLEDSLICKNSPVYLNSTLKGGYRAGNYTNLGKVANMSECVRLCCGNSQCNAALMLENNCFFVACKDSDSCIPVKAKTTHALTALNPRVSFITSRSEEAPIPKQKTEEGVCKAGVISYDVSLKGGSFAGNFTPHGRVHNMEECILRCCKSKGCDLAMMLKDICFTVICKNDQSCEKKHTPLSSKFNAKVAYVFKEKNQDKVKQGNVRHSKQKKVSSKRKKLLENNNNYSWKATNGIPPLELSSNQRLTGNQSTNSYPPLGILANQQRLENQSKPSAKKIITGAYKKQTLNQKISTVRVTNLTTSALPNARSDNTTIDDIIDYVTHVNGDAKPKSCISCELTNSSLQANECFDKPCMLKHGKRKEVLNKGDNIPLPTVRIGRGENNVKSTSSSKQTFKNQVKPSPKVIDFTNLNNISSHNYPGYPKIRQNSEHSHIENSTTLGRSSNETARSLWPQVRAEKRKFEGDDPSCTYSEVLHNATLRGNLHSGKFANRGEMDDIRQCVRLCCMLKGCDLAFMLKKKCFTVTCENSFLCEPVRAKSVMFSPTICYILVKPAAG